MHSPHSSPLPGHLHHLQSGQLVVLRVQQGLDLPPVHLHHDLPLGAGHNLPYQLGYATSVVNSLDLHGDLLPHLVPVGHGVVEENHEAFVDNSGGRVFLLLQNFGGKKLSRSCVEHIKIGALNFTVIRLGTFLRQRTKKD